MKQRKKTIFVSFFLAVAVFLSVGFTAYAATGTPVNVTFQNRSDKFVMLPSNNLFPDFAGVMPGAVQDQEITVNNASSEEITLYLRAEPEDAGRFVSAEEHQISEELVEVLKLEVTLYQPDGGERLLYSGPLSGDPGVGGNTTMLEKINLGDYGSGVSSRLVAQLKVPETLGNRYQNAVARVKWIFSCNITDEIDIPDEPIPLDPTPPGGVGTGDNGNLVIPALLLALSTGAVVILVAVSRRRKGKNSSK